MNNPITLEELIDFIREESGAVSTKISEQTSIEDDLGVTGDDAVELMIKYAKLFNVDLSGFSPIKYFHPEPSIFASYRKISAINVGHLKQGIDAGFLNDGMIEMSVY